MSDVNFYKVQIAQDAEFGSFHLRVSLPYLLESMIVPS